MPDFVGCRTLEIIDPALGVAFPLLVLYPTNSPAQPEAIGPYTIQVALEAPIAPGPGRPLLGPLLVRGRPVGPVPRKPVRAPG